MCLAGSLRSDRHGLGQKCTFVCVAVAAALWERAGQNGPDCCKGESEHGVQAEGAAPAEPSRDDAREGKREKGGLWSETGEAAGGRGGKPGVVCTPKAQIGLNASAWRRLAECATRGVSPPAGRQRGLGAMRQHPHWKGCCAGTDM